MKKCRVKRVNEVKVVDRKTNVAYEPSKLFLTAKNRVQLIQA